MNNKLVGSIVGVAAVAVIAILIVPSLFAGKTITINGAGSSFINPEMSQWITEYQGNNSNVRINYNSVGSGTGVSQLKSKVIDFGASDAPLSHTEYADFGNAIHIPMTTGGISLAYNIPGISDGLKLNGTVVAQIWMGNITKWNDIAIKQLNPTINNLPSNTIVTVSRSDGSGTTYGFTDYLTHVSTSWKTHYGTNKVINWPVGVTGKGNEGVSANIKQASYSIGYVELSYVHLNNFNTVALENQHGDFVQATTDGIKTAVTNAAATLPTGSQSWENVSLVNAPGADSYPICSFSYVIVYKDLNNVKDQATAQALIDFLYWCLHEGQNYATRLFYVPLSSAVVNIDVASLKLLTYNGLALTVPTT